LGLAAVSGSFGLVALIVGFATGRREAGLAQSSSSSSSSSPHKQSLLHHPEGRT
jgi:hypothetical protein